MSDWATESGITRFEQDGRFGVTISPRTISFDDEGSIGSGSSMKTVMFLSAEGRNYWIVAEQLRHEVKCLVSERCMLLGKLAELATAKGLRAFIMALTPSRVRTVRAALVARKRRRK